MILKKNIFNIYLIIIALTILTQDVIGKDILKYNKVYLNKININHTDEKLKNVKEKIDKLESQLKQTEIRCFLCC